MIHGPSNVKCHTEVQDFSYTFIMLLVSSYFSQIRMGSMLVLLNLGIISVLHIYVLLNDFAFSSNYLLLNGRMFFSVTVHNTFNLKPCQTLSSTSMLTVEDKI